ncbi:molybdenum cofactor biosysynthesis protein [Micromonospora globbae]|uniref:Molybdenum cofactor biosysynthesis protein n=1 Tax=Micromonospora globbae TaxID=1894969 RepID=A0A420F0A6_9ACTN|nr:molybdenum cofactor biosysynthesis protein [Micromonospora globbae]RKF26368.1 molybdenum cofactor biosysynthesis protein [Micromonospora globbae]
MSGPVPPDGPRIVQLLASPVHRYVGRPADGPAPAPPGELVEEVQLRAGLGIVGDRYFGRPAHREASVTLIARESLPPGADLRQVRRNVLTAGIAVDELVGKILVLDSGAGPVRLRVNRPANPCAWMDVAIGPGAWRALRRRGGVRCAPLTDGLLRVGPVDVTIEEPDAHRP